MRRKLAMIAVLGGLAAGLGCQHIGGKSDCGYNPADYQIAPVTTPYPTFPVMDLSQKPKEKDKTPVDPKKTGSDTDPKGAVKDKDKGNDGNN
ncbi:MAG: hypothetical protein C0467_14740 [Planctomycetaceae bacterium]|nr:hypothetical protein [Planctomycetaceae bacterium]